MYFEVAKWGKNSAGRYIAGFLITFFGYAILGSIPLLAVLATSPGGMDAIMGGSLDPHTMNEVIGSKNGSFILLTTIFVFTMLCFWFVIHFIHGKRMKWIATGAKDFRWNMFWFAFFVGALAIITSLLFSYFTSPEELNFRFNAKKFGLLVLIASVMIPIQAGWEELFFRGYLMQAFGLLTKNKLVALLITTLFFAAVHMANPEVVEHGWQTMFPLYAIMGLSFGLMVLLSNGLELAMGYHIANNYWISLLISSPESVLQTDSLFFTDKVKDMSGEVWALLLFNIVVLGIFAWRYGWLKTWKESLLAPIH